MYGINKDEFSLKTWLSAMILNRKKSSYSDLKMVLAYRNLMLENQIKINDRTDHCHFLQ